MDRRCSVVGRGRRRLVVAFGSGRRTAMGRAFVVDRMERTAESSREARCPPVAQQLTAFGSVARCRRIGSLGLGLA